MSNYSTLLQPVYKVLADREDLKEVFEREIRSVLGGIELPDLLSGKISDTLIRESVVSALQEVSRLTNESYESTKNLEDFKISCMLWNPMVASLLLSTPITNSASTSNSDAIPRKGASSTVSSASTASKGARKPTGKVKPVQSPVDRLATDVQTIHAQLNSTSLTRKVLYRTSAHPHIKCEVSQCQFCRDMFFSVNLTRCEGHKPCSKTGWYPHVGTALWQMLKTKHATQKCTLKPKPPKAHELPSLQDTYGSEHMGYAASRMDADVEYSPSRPGFITDDVEAYATMLKKRKTEKRPVSPPPVSKRTASDMADSS